MKKLLLSVALITASFMSNAQVGINKTTPEGALDVVSTNSGIVMPRVANVRVVTSPVDGMMVYDLFNKCMRAFEAGVWTNCLNGTIAVIATGPCQGQPQEFTFNGLTYKPVVSDGKCWLDRNLGASQVAASSTDFNAYGSLYQWGRKSDGHEIINWTSSTASDGAEQSNQEETQSSSPSPGAAFITGSENWYTGTAPDPNDLWKEDGTGVNNPCPTGYRVPTFLELVEERSSWAPDNNAAGAFASPLKLPVAGYRDGDGLLINVGGIGVYWSSSVSGTSARYLYFISGNANMDTNYRAGGFSVRCLKD